MLQEDLKRSTPTFLCFPFLLPLPASLSDKHLLMWCKDGQPASSRLPSYRLRVLLPQHPVLLSEVSAWALTGLAHPALGAGGRVSRAKPRVHWEGVILRGCWATQTHAPTINGSFVVEGSACGRLDQPSQLVQRLSLRCPASCLSPFQVLFLGRRLFEKVAGALFRPQLGAIDFSPMS